MSRTFRFKNLVINILPKEAERVAQQQIELCRYPSFCRYPTYCRYPSFCRYYSPCGYLSPCGGFSPCGISFDCPGGSMPVEQTPELTAQIPKVTQIEELAVLKDDLKHALAEVEKQEKILAEAERPQTLEEAEKVEKELKDALKEVEAAKAQLKKKGD